MKLKDLYEEKEEDIPYSEVEDSSEEELSLDELVYQMKPDCTRWS